MKIPATVRQIHEDQSIENTRLQKVVDDLVRGTKDRRWHYESRVKSLESFALKLESGRTKFPNKMEDFFACLLVVPNFGTIQQAEDLVLSHFDLEQRRPAKQNKTYKAPDQFPFDDLRLYLRLKTVPALPPRNLEHIIFELQIKTFLQHAWSIATHDLIYKTDEVSWSKARIAYQTKAMLEHAEVSIQEAAVLAACAALNMEDESTRRHSEVMSLLKEEWEHDQLPRDVKRLAENVSQLLLCVETNMMQLKAILAAGKAAHGGAHPSNLSPYATIVQYLFEQNQDKIRSHLEATEPKSKFKVFIPGEIALPPAVSRNQLKNAVLTAATS